MNECVCRFQHHTTKLRVVLRAFPKKKNAQQQRESSSSSRCVVVARCCSNNEREENLLLSRKVSLSLLFLSKCAQSSREKKDDMKLFKNLSLLFSLCVVLDLFFFFYL